MTVALFVVVDEQAIATSSGVPARAIHELALILRVMFCATFWFRQAYAYAYVAAPWTVPVTLKQSITASLVVDALL